MMGGSPVDPLVIPLTFTFFADDFGNFFDSSGPAAVKSPSTIRCSPVTNSASSLARKVAAPAADLLRLITAAFAAE